MKLGFERLQTLAELTKRLTIVIGQILTRLSFIEENGTSGGGSTPANLDDKIPVGSITPFAGAVATVPNKWLLCNGDAVSRSTYPQLFSKIGTTYGAGDGSTTFNLPDLRGEFIRGLDEGRGVDSGRTLGSAQGDSTARPNSSFTTDTDSHNHDFRGTSSGGSGSGSIGSRARNIGRDNGGAAFEIRTDTDSHNHTITGGGDAETRPRNVALNYIIRVDVDTSPAPVAYEIPDGSVTPIKTSGISSYDSADYTPSVFSISNASSFSVNEAHYEKFSNTVHVWASISGNVNAAFVIVDFDLPLGHTVSSNAFLNGTCYRTANARNIGVMLGSSADSGRARMGIESSAGGSQTFRVHFSYFIE